MSGLRRQMMAKVIADSSNDIITGDALITHYAEELAKDFTLYSSGGEVCCCLEEWSYLPPYWVTERPLLMALQNGSSNNAINNVFSITEDNPVSYSNTKNYLTLYYYDSEGIDNTIDYIFATSGSGELHLRGNILSLTNNTLGYLRNGIDGTNNNYWVSGSSVFNRLFRNSTNLTTALLPLSCIYPDYHYVYDIFEGCSNLREIHIIDDIGISNNEAVNSLDWEGYVFLSGVSNNGKLYMPKELKIEFGHNIPEDWEVIYNN